jgi:hypothetical protein
MNEKENMNMRKQGKVYDVTTEHVYHHPAARKTMNKKVVNGGPLPPTRLPKPVDEDLYKIPPELLRTTKRVGQFFLKYYYLCYCELCL